MKTDLLSILYEDNDIIVCRKPHGLPVQTRRAADPDMETLIKNHIAANAAGIPSSREPSSRQPYLAVIHRLDQPVAGILVFAKTPAAARELNRQLQNEGFGKYYLAETEGTPPVPEGTLEDYLVKDGRTNTSRICDKETPGAKPARLHYRTISPESAGALTDTGIPAKENSAHTFLEIHLDTGRHHQIRVQLAHMGCPIVGDTKYNPSAPDAGNSSASGGIRRERSGQQDKQELMLCAYKLSFLHPRTKEKMCFVLP